MTETLKVVHCLPGNLYGGVEAFARSLAEFRHAVPGLEHEFAVCFEGRIADELRHRGAEVHRLGAVRFSRPWTVWKARRRLERVLREKNAGVVVGHGCWSHLLAAPAARRAGRGVVFYMHDIISGEHWVERAAAKVTPDRVVVNSFGTLGTLSRLFPDAPSDVIPYPVPATPCRTGDRAGVRAEIDTPDGDVAIVTACRLERWKGQSLLIESLGLLRDEPGWTAWVAGGAQRPHERVYLDELRASARDRGISARVRFLGQRDDVPRLLAAADIHCQPNTGPEPFGIAFVEALYAGLPVVSTRMGGAAEIVTDDCGVLVPPGDPATLAATLGRLIADPVARARLGKAGPARAAALCAPEAVLPRLGAAFRAAAPRSMAVTA